MIISKDLFESILLSLLFSLWSKFLFINISSPVSGLIIGIKLLIISLVFLFIINGSDVSLLYLISK